MRRDLRFDSLRGAMLVLMTLQHMVVSLGFLLDRPVGPMAGAEPFVLLSGLICGLGYTRAYLRSGPESFRGRVRRRAGFIYAAHVLSVLFCCLLLNLSATYAASWGARAPLFVESPLWGALLGSFMLYQPEYFDILPMFVLFYLLVPPVTVAFCQGRWKRVLACSFGLWLLMQVLFAGIGFDILNLEKDFLKHLGPVNLGHFVFLSWQFLFVSGLMIGSFMMRHPDWKLPSNKRYVAAAAAALSFFIFLRYRRFAVMAGLLAQDGMLMEWLNFLWVAKGNSFLGPIVVANFIAFGYLWAVIGVKAPQLLHWRPLAILGRHSLLVFTFHLILCILISPLERQFASLSVVPASLVSLCLIALLWLPPLLIEARSKLKQQSVSQQGELPTSVREPQRLRQAL